MTVGHRVPTRGPWVSFKKPTLERLPVRNVAALGNEALSVLGDAFDGIATKLLEPIASLNADPVRREIDTALMTALQLSDVKLVSELLAQEPILCNSRIESKVTQIGFKYHPTATAGASG